MILGVFFVDHLLLPQETTDPIARSDRGPPFAGLRSAARRVALRGFGAPAACSEGRPAMGTREGLWMGGMTWTCGDFI